MKNLQISIIRASWHKVDEEKITYYEPILEGVIKNKNGADISVTVHFGKELSTPKEAETRAGELLSSFT